MKLCQASHKLPALGACPGAKRTPEAAAENYGYVCGHKTLCRRGIKGIWIWKTKPDWRTASSSSSFCTSGPDTLFFVVFWTVRGYSNCKLQNDRAYFALFRWVDRLNLLATPVAEIAGQIPDLRLARSGPAWPTFYPDLGGIMP